jgi:hypothetical protein
MLLRQLTCKTMQDEIIDKIKKAEGWVSSRYEIDQQLIEAGYDAAEIDAAWNQLNTKAEKPKRKLSFKRLFTFLHLANFRLITLNIALVVLLASAYDVIPYYWLRHLKFYAIFLILVLIITGICLLVRFRNTITRQTKAAMLWFWGTIFFFSICSTIGQGSWEKKAEFVTNQGTFFLIAKEDGFIMTGDTFEEIYRCQFANIICARVNNEHYVERTVDYSNGLGTILLINFYNKEYGGK